MKHTIMHEQFDWSQPIGDIAHLTGSAVFDNQIARTPPM